MLDALRFVRGAVSRKDYAPELKHFVVKDGMVRAFNGTLALCSPIQLDVACAPLAELMIKAIAGCEDVVALRLTDSDKLVVHSGAFTSYVPCLPLEGVPEVVPSGTVAKDIDGAALLTAIQKALPFVGNDATRPWTNGVLLHEGSAFATNNICLVQCWSGVTLPASVNIPFGALVEIERVGEPPVAIQMDDNSITFHYQDSRWIRSQVLSADWPDINRILDVQSNPQPVPEGLFDAMVRLKPFLGDGRYVYIKDGSICTSPDPDTGASYKLDNLPSRGAYLYPMLQLLEPVAQTVDFDRYPSPITFFGEKIRGVILGRSE